MRGAAAERAPGPRTAGPRTRPPVAVSGEDGEGRAHVAAPGGLERDRAEEEHRRGNQAGGGPAPEVPGDGHPGFLPIVRVTRGALLAADEWAARGKDERGPEQGALHAASSAGDPASGPYVGV